MMWALIACKRGVATDFSFLLRPIRGQLNKVSEFVDTVSFYLQSNAEHMHEWRQIQRDLRGCSSASLIEGRYISPKLKQALSSAVSIWSTGEEESEEVREFFARFEDLIHNLQKAFRECSSSIGELAGYGSAEELRLRLKSSSIISNEEVKTVNSVLCCTKDLVQALKTISASMTRLRAYRDIRLTQSGIRDQVSNEKAL